MVPKFWKGCKFGCKNQNKDCAENCVRLVQNGNKAYGSIDSLSGDTFVEIVPSGAGRGSEGKISHPLRNLQAGKEYLVHFLLARRPDKTGSQDQLQANVKIGVLRPSLEHDMYVYKATAAVLIDWTKGIVECYVVCTYL